MPTIPRPMRTPVFPLAAAVSLALTPALHGQPEQRPPGETKLLSALRVAEVPPRLVSLHFPGGTLTEFVAALKDAADSSPVNVVIRGEADDIRIQEVALEQVAIGSALELVSGYHSIGESVVRVELSTPGSFGPRTAVEGEPVYLMEIRRETPRRTTLPARPMPAETLVVSVRDLIVPLPGDPADLALPKESVLTAIETALTTAAQHAEPTVRFHAETGLVILHAPPDALAAAQSAIGAIGTDLMHRRNMARSHALRSESNTARIESELADAQAHLELQAIAMERAHQRVALSEREVAEYRALLEKDAVSTAQLRQAEERLAESQAMARAAEVERTRAAKRAESLVTMVHAARQHGAAPVEHGHEAGARVAQLAAENAALRERVAALEAELRTLRAEMARLRGRDGGGR